MYIRPETSSEISEEVIEKLRATQKRCVNCGRTYALQIHHRIFKSEGEIGLSNFLEVALRIYKNITGIELQKWHLNDIQNLVVLCVDCHEGKLVGIHGGNRALRNRMRNTYTAPNTGFNIPFYKKKDNFLL